MKTVVMTLCFVIKGNRVLLGFKKVDTLGSGLWNGFGGKVNLEEDIEDAAKREVLEESGIEVLNLEKLGILTYINFERVNEVHIYKVTEYQGTSKETYEMKSRWFDMSKVFYGEVTIWDDMLFWFDNILKNRCFEGTIYYNNDNTKVLAHTLKPFCVPSRSCLISIK